MSIYENVDVEELRQKLIDEVESMGFLGMGGAFLDVNKIKNADEDTLREIARQHRF